MTPLAQELAKKLLLAPKKDRPTYEDKAQVLPRMFEDTHYFDMVDVIDVIDVIAEKFREQGQPLVGMDFLPAPRTWLELCLTKRELDRVDEPFKVIRLAYLIEQDGERATVSLISRNGTIAVGQIGLSEVGRVWYAWRELEDEPRDFIFRLIYAALAIINTPKIIGRRQHMPHRGLERALRKTGAIGKYPLRAWTEIVLEARPTYVDESGDTHEAHLTGRKCLHFCRAHLRVQNGRLVLVSSHWRGDPALGIKRTRYRVAA